MSFLVPIGLLMCSALWLKGLKALWARALLLASFLALLFVVLPAVSQDKSNVSLAIYQKEAREFADRVAALIERGNHEVAVKQLRYFSKNQVWETAVDPDALHRLYQGAESVAAGTAASGASPIPSATK